MRAGRSKCARLPDFADALLSQGTASFVPQRAASRVARLGFIVSLGPKAGAGVHSACRETSSVPKGEDVKCREAPGHPLALCFYPVVKVSSTSTHKRIMDVLN